MSFNMQAEERKYKSDSLFYSKVSSVHLQRPLSGQGGGLPPFRLRSGCLVTRQQAIACQTPVKGCGPGSQTSVLDPTGACAKSAQAGVTCDLPTRKEWKGVVARPPERTESAPKVLEAGG